MITSLLEAELVSMLKLIANILRFPGGFFIAAGAS
jgi:hypothetical protein